MAAAISVPVLPAPDQRLTVRMAWRLLRNDPAAYASAWLQWVGFHAFPVLVGVVLKLVLDRVAGDNGGISAWSLLAVLAGLEAARWALLVSAAWQWHGAWVGWQTVPRVNLLRSILTDPGPASGRLPGSPGEAVSRFRDDTQDLALVLDVWLDISGVAVASAAALAVLLSVDARVTLFAVLPVLAALLLCRELGPRLRAWRAASRQATAAVTGYIGDLFGSVLAVKAAGAEKAALARFEALNAARREAARRDQVGTAVVQSVSGATGEAAIGLVLLLVVPAVRRGDLGVGDLALFASELTVMASLPRWAGRLGAYQRQADVSVHRLAELVHDDHDRVVAPVQTHLRHGPPRFRPRTTEATALDVLDVDGITAIHAATGRGVRDVSFTLRRGELLAVTGPVGSGKSSLLRALLGLVDRQAGTISWNGTVIDDPATILVPPLAAYLPQVPRLFSEALSDTILLGEPDEWLAEAIRLACLDDDIAGMPDGLATVVGPRGVRLSGGQVQRAAAARLLVRRPALLVIDDLSSALDVETEARLWDGLEATGEHTAIVVTHRPRVLERADQVLRL